MPSKIKGEQSIDKPMGKMEASDVTGSRPQAEGNRCLSGLRAWQMPQFDSWQRCRRCGNSSWKQSACRVKPLGAVNRIDKQPAGFILFFRKSNDPRSTIWHLPILPACFLVQTWSFEFSSIFEIWGNYVFIETHRSNRQSNLRPKNWFSIILQYVTSKENPAPEAEA